MIRAQVVPKAELGAPIAANSRLNCNCLLVSVANVGSPCAAAKESRAQTVPGYAPHKLQLSLWGRHRAAELWRILWPLATFFGAPTIRCVLNLATPPMLHDKACINVDLLISLLPKSDPIYRTAGIVRADGARPKPSGPTSVWIRHLHSGSKTNV